MNFQIQSLEYPKEATIGITGCGGYVGNVLVRHLLNLGYRVRGLDNFHKGQCDALLSVIDHPNFEFQYGDVTSKPDVKKFVDGLDGIIHLAAIVGVPATTRQPALSHVVNIEGTENVLLANPTLPLVSAQTGSQYGKVEGVCTEDSPQNTDTIYGLTKKRAEELVVQGDKTVCLRFATAFGVSPCMRVNLLINDLIYRAYTDRSINIFQADFKRTFIHVTDMARALEWSLRGLITGEVRQKVYNCGDDKLNFSKREIAEIIRGRTGCFVTYADTHSDPDQRSYTVSHRLLNNDGFFCKTTLMKGIDDLLKCIPLLQIRHQYE